MQIRDTILLVDASASNRAALRKILEGRFNMLEAVTDAQAELLFHQNHECIAVVLLDIGFLERFVHLRKDPSIPLIAIIGEADARSEHRAFDLGASDVILKPFHPLLVERRIGNLIELYRNKWALEALVEEQSTALRHTNEAMVDALSSIIECRSVESGQHVLRIRRFTRILLEEIARCCPEYGLTDRVIQAISSAASLHDIGKIAIPDNILNKPESLTAEEYEVMKTHTLSGSDILTRLDSIGDEEYLRYAYNICRYHHERWTGKGYPEGLAGDDIPICAQVVGLADAYDALTTHRVYKPAYSCNEATNMILNGECGEFSPKLLECFKHVRTEFAELACAYADGFSPKSDAIAAPLAPPNRVASNTLHTLLTKYTALLHYLDVSVAEVDLDEGVYHLIYNPDPDFALISEANTLDNAMAKWSERIYTADGRPLSAQYFRKTLEDFFASDLRKRTFHDWLRGMDNANHPYDVTILRLDNDVNTRKAIIIWQKKDMTHDLSPAAEERGLKRTLTSLLGISQPFVYDRWLTMEHISHDLISMLGYTEEEIRQQFQGRMMELILPEARAGIQALLKEQLSDGSVCEVTLPLVRKDGQVVWTIGKGILAADKDNVEHIYGILVDITQTHKAQEKLQQVLDQQQLITAQTSDIVFELDLVADRLICSHKWEERFGYKPLSEKISITLPEASHFHPDDIPIWQEKLAQIKAGTRFVEFTVRVADANGRYQWSRVRATLQRDEQGRPVKAVGVFIDIDSELRASWAMIDSANRDSLTKLLNKDACRHEIEAFLNENHEAGLSALAIIDLDNFKEVNDRYGHLFGDAVLTRVSAEISNLFRGTDVVARIGGDEFLVFMPDIPNCKLAEDRFQILLDKIQSLYAEQLADVQLSCSIGISLAPEHGTAYQELFQRADRALYQAKNLGKSCFCFYAPNASLSAHPTMVSKRIDSDVQPGMANNSLIQYVFERLYESGDMDGTIQSLLEIVGTQMDVSRVYIFENSPDNTTCSNTFEWCNEGISPEIQNLQNLSYETDLPNFSDNYNERGIFYCPDVTQLPQHLRDILEPQGIKSMLHCAIRDQGKFRGYVGFDENTVNRLWTQEQIDLLTFLSQVLSVFLLKQRVQEHTNALVQDLRKVLDNQYAWTYVIDPDTFQLRFLNGKTLALAPDAKVGAYCYKVLMGEDAPCKNCPTLSGDGTGGSCVIDNYHFALRVRATAYTIHWDGKPSWLITCREFPR